MGRGMITDALKAKGKEFLGEELTVRQLRLLPYLDYGLKNGGDISNTNQEERTIIDKWVEAGYIVASIGTIASATKEFYDFMQEILWLSYVNYDRGE